MSPDASPGWTFSMPSAILLLVSCTLLPYSYSLIVCADLSRLPKTSCTLKPFLHPVSPSRETEASPNGFPHPRLPLPCAGPQGNSRTHTVQPAI
ncbi:uncharacterized protein EDB91DRAFT_1160529 [Suillus paluster]|uniref:uncharacterized protein n=1 Tax=Suillus paluster TaxID=48578 RepID=UPI001B8776C5|nr:uncharacterized protein EDB91DRAFT_1160529 [Suillus paluster]KAG1728843.1 hypothetical protein EDB91DRAFT_1160529 [Suillus paluster]